MIVSLVRSQEHILKLDHSGVGEQQGLVTTGDQRGGPHKFVTSLNEEINKSLANLVAR